MQPHQAGRFKAKPYGRFAALTRPFWRGMGLGMDLGHPRTSTKRSLRGSLPANCFGLFCSASGETALRRSMKPCSPAGYSLLQACDCYTCLLRVAPTSCPGERSRAGLGSRPWSAWLMINRGATSSRLTVSDEKGRQGAGEPSVQGRHLLAQTERYAGAACVKQRLGGEGSPWRKAVILPDPHVPAGPKADVTLGSPAGSQ